jgi:myo-inositol-1(or 4)-monophosphatase
MQKYSREYDLAVAAAQKAADLLLRDFSDNARIERVEGKDIKTQADREAEEVIIEVLSASGIPVLAEESSAGKSWDEGLCWLVDPLDGTMNFTRGFHIYGVSIALWNGREPIMGVVWDGMTKRLFSGMVGAGAWLDRDAIGVSTTSDTAQSILATGFPVGRSYSEASLAAFMSRVQRYKKIRMLGSAALSLAWVAAGRFDAYFEEDIMIWDVAAGLALVTAAGGHFDMQPGRHPHSVHVFAHNGRLPES